MNTSAKGNSYEWAFKHVLENRQGVKHVMRTAASHGLFDLIAISSDMPGGWVDFYQLKSSRMGCVAAVNLLTALWRRLGMPTNYGLTVVHQTKEKAFCEH